jgi:hypothetical protein
MQSIEVPHVAWFACNKGEAAAGMWWDCGGRKQEMVTSASVRTYFTLVKTRGPTFTSAFSRSIPWRLSRTDWRISRIIESN